MKKSISEYSDILASAFWIISLLLLVLISRNGQLQTLVNWLFAGLITSVLSVAFFIYLAIREKKSGELPKGNIEAEWDTLSQDSTFLRSDECWVSILFFGQWHLLLRSPGATEIFYRASYVTIELTLLVILCAQLVAVAAPALGFGLSEGDIIPQSSFQTAFVFLATFSAVYWNLKNVFGNKWNYCANLYNQIRLKRVGASNPDSDREIQGLYSALCSDLIDCGLWHHKSFKGVFVNHLSECCEYMLSGNKSKVIGSLNVKKEIDEATLFNALKNGLLTLEDITEILGEYSSQRAQEAQHKEAT